MMILNGLTICRPTGYIYLTVHLLLDIQLVFLQFSAITKNNTWRYGFMLLIVDYFLGAVFLGERAQTFFFFGSQWVLLNEMLRRLHWITVPRGAQDGARLGIFAWLDIVLFQRFLPAVLTV